MPKLWEYKPSSKKSGYYIRANVGSSHPVTLQVTSLARIIFEQTGYKPNQAVPTKLVWAMYDLGLLYTNKSLNTSKVKNVSTGEILQELELGNKLSNQERKRLISYIQEYEGPQKGKLTRLKEELENSANSKSRKITTRETEPSVQQPMPETIDEGISYIYTLARNVSKYRKVKKYINKTYLLQTLQTFIPHPYADTRKANITREYLLSYPITPPEEEITCWLTDHREQTTPDKYHGADYVCRFFTDEGCTIGAIKDNRVVYFKPADEDQYSLKEFENDLTWILPLDPVEIDEIVRKDDLTQNYDIEYNEKNRTITRYKDRKMEPCGQIQRYCNIPLQLVKVDRISNSGNPVIEIDGSPYVLNKGKPGDEYLVEKTDKSQWRAVSKAV